LVHSPFPVLRIWEVNQPEAADTETVNLGSGPDFLLVFRKPSGIYMRRIHEDDHRLLAAFAAGKSLDTALEVNLASNPRFDLSAALRRCIEFGVFTQMTFDQSTL
jgi:hypothetical protein